jgi:hypothetical protein
MTTKADKRRREAIAANPGLEPELRWYLDQLNDVTAIWGTTSTTSTTTTTTTTTE